MSNFIESLESRQHLSVATKTTISASVKKALLGGDFTVTAKVSNTAARGTVELLNNGKATGLTGTLNHKGYTVFNFGPGASLFVGKYKLSARYLSSGNFVGSKSSAVQLAISSPPLTTESDGLEIGEVQAGTGAVAAAGQSATVEYTGFLTSGSVFDDSAEHGTGTYTFDLDASPEAVIKGFDQGITGMKVGETRILVIPSALGYSDGDTRIFVVKLDSLAAET